MNARPYKRLRFVVESIREDLRAMPDQVRYEFGVALRIAQWGGKDEAAEPMKRYGGAGVLEIAKRHDGNTYRCYYTVRYEEEVYVLYAWHKKSTSGIKTPTRVLDAIDERLKRAREMHDAWAKGHE